MPCTDDPAVDADYDPKDHEEFSSDYIYLKYKEKVVALAEAHPKRSLATLKKKKLPSLKKTKRYTSAMEERYFKR